ncbi:bifunctional Nucleoside triphosphate pyrophosphatase Maf-like protein/Inosine triphosphate pyrophosphatase-like [Babesia duncani]|uniref:Bifunctional Nucleoside triphosphate pyrophosphatase Maf-like protein/Inosine triphosphate pyrophosphatase-like n=1 Tax=Babesia duncani TaxID=323732 RepID=A0AAD9PI05_9APIC|nr:bifunctional Nucleoside triphosphate pyrophosphatase Maf-like protein/Inosine triphosphate pyrophosphatase-like [Babesia duncani]KAK2196445.1 bifunctional Nucleoside triphosphate pyrophosphatase Maf-like protein/Inosine triphosphate pyrophosphatase-like [Babesia duncani]
MEFYSALGLGDEFTNVKKSWIVLATESRYRAKILFENVGIKNVLLMGSGFEENLDPYSYKHFSDYCTDTAINKAKIVAETLFRAHDEQTKQQIEARLVNYAYPNLKVDLNKIKLVIGADTVVESQSQILEKPRDINDARRQLESYQNGQEYFVYTGVALFDRELKCVSKFNCCTSLRFGKLSPEEIETLLEKNEHIGTAGSCRISGLAEGLIEEIKGSYTNVIGLPAFKTSREIARVWKGLQV